MAPSTYHGQSDSVAALPIVNSDRVAIVDTADLTMLSPHRWYLADNGYIKRIYRWIGDQRTHSVYMHRQILGVLSNVYVDHIDHDKLNNTRANLRECTQSEQLGNQYPRGGTSVYKGVHRSRRGRWIASLHFAEKTTYLGTFASEAEAARAYDTAAVAYFGRFALLNFPLPERVARALAQREGAA